LLDLPDGTTHGGHFLESHVHPILDIVIIETPANPDRRKKVNFRIVLIGIDCATETGAH
jgi:predicted DNA-binding protein with PD1-like motif